MSHFGQRLESWIEHHQSPITDDWSLITPKITVARKGESWSTIWTLRYSSINNLFRRWISTQANYKPFTIKKWRKMIKQLSKYVIHKTYVYEGDRYAWLCQSPLTHFGWCSHPLKTPEKQKFSLVLYWPEKGLKSLTIFIKKLHHWCLTRF